MTIQDLKKGDQFKFNDDTFKVSRKWLDEDRPLIAYHERTGERHDFWHEGLEIIKL